MIEMKILLGLAALLLFASLFKLKFSNQLRIYEKIFILLIIFSGIILIVNPLILYYIARTLNLTRGTDLIVCAYIFVSSWCLIRNHIRLNLLNQKINLLSSELALINPKKNN